MMEIRGKSISYTSYKQEQKLIKEIQFLEDNLTENNIQSLEELKLESCILIEANMKGFLVRSRENNIENGENPFQFFCNLETKKIYKQSNKCNRKR